MMAFPLFSLKREDSWNSYAPYHMQVPMCMNMRCRPARTVLLSAWSLRKSPKKQENAMWDGSHRFDHSFSSAPDFFGRTLLSLHSFRASFSFEAITKSFSGS